MRQHWRSSPQGALAEILLLDQIPRNIYRGHKKSFAFDRRALSAAKAVLAQGLDKKLPREKRSWLYMPFMHSESLVAQQQGLALFSSLGKDHPALPYMRSHAEIIEQFGRFPHRNELLGRRSTKKEKIWLAGKGDAYHTKPHDPFITLPSGLKLAVEREKPQTKRGVPILLMRGLGTQLIEWPFSFITGLLSLGHEVIIYDHRDAGLSDKTPKPYRLEDMADDALDLIKTLNLSRVHLVGISMGGMIAALAAARDRQKHIASLTCIMSAPGMVEEARPDRATAKLFAERPARTQGARLAQEMRLARHIGSTCQQDWQKLTRIKHAAFKRAGRGREQGVARHYRAILASGDIRPALASIACPALVLHGAADRLIPLKGGKTLAAAIPQAAFASIPKMGHDMAEPLLPSLVARLGKFFTRVEGGQGK